MPRPNVIVVFTDQHRWDTTGVHGNPLELTPVFDRMAMRGTHIANAFTCQPVCGPARSALQTGQYPTTNGCWKNGISLKRDQRTLGHHFRDGGYRAGYIGKWHLADAEPVPLEQRGGYQDWLAANALEFTSDAYDAVVYDEENRRVKLPGYRVDALMDAAIRYVDRHQAEPFYLFLSFLEPHHQNHRDDYPAPDGYAERYAGRWTPPDLAALTGSAPQHLGGYLGMIKRLDEALGRLLDALKSLNMLDNTVVLFTSDHGNHFKTRNSEYKRSCHEASIRIPAAVCGPGFNGGGQLRQLVSLIDLPPTLLDAAGLPIPPQMQGRSFLPLLHGDKSTPRTEWPSELFVQISESQVGRAVRTSRWKYCVVAKGKNGWEVPNSDQYTEESLYDLLADPHELTNLIEYGSHKEVKQILRARLLKRLTEAGEPPATITPAPDAHGGGQRRVTPEEARS